MKKALFILPAALLAAAFAQSPPIDPSRVELTIDNLFPDKSFLGKTARGMSWSHDDRYVAYLWNPYDDNGSDIWVHDTVGNRSWRLTSLEQMAAFDRDTRLIAEKVKRQKERDEQLKGKEGEEKKKLEEQFKKEDEELRKSNRWTGSDYGGISSFEWANSRHELLYLYKGDIYRLPIHSQEPTRLTRTDEHESNVRYTKDDTGFFFRRGNHVFRMDFASPVVRQLNPALPHNMSMGGYSISPDETKLMISSGRSTGQNRQVSYITYRDRFAQVRTVERGVADDEFKGESYLFLYDLNDDPAKNPDHDGKPWQIYHWPAGKEFGQTSLARDPWSADSSKFVFATWKRDLRQLEIVVADISKKETDVVYSDIQDVGHNSPGMAQPFFTPDGSQIVMLNEKSGFRHVWAVDLATKEPRQISSGNFEVYPVKIAPDGKTLCVVSNREHVSRSDIYHLNLSDGKMMRVSARSGTYGDPAVSNDCTKMATLFRSWDDLNELFVLADGREQKVTDSHPDTWSRLATIKPQYFSYQNRKGDTISGYMYLPPDYKPGDRRPLFIYTYGGPLGRGKDVVEGNTNRFNMYLTLKHGYITATIDPRGMSGYGAKFETANWQNPGIAQAEDLADGVRWFRRTYSIDPDRVGIYGWSFGGYQTQVCMYTEPDVFKLGIAGAGPTEWQNYNTWYTGGVIGFSRLGKPEDLDRFSLTKMVGGLRSPMMLIHGVEDDNVLYQDTVKVYQALLRAGKGPLVELVIDPTGGHGLGGDIKAKDQYKIYEAFIKKHWR
jgi:dipeptidyl-peptidase 4